MAGSIGSAALVLSTNATKLLGGVKDAAGKAVGMVKGMKANVTAQLKGMFSGGVALAAGMASFELLKQGITSLVTGLKTAKADALALGIALSDEDSSAIDAASASMDTAYKTIQKLYYQLMAALAPAFQTVGEIIERVGSRMQPIFSAAGQALAVLFEVAAAVIEIAIGLIDQAIIVIGQWIESVVGAGAVWPTVGEIVTGVLRAIAKAGAYAFDTLMAGVGAVTVAIGFLTEHVLTRLIWAFHQVAKLAKTIPNSIKPSWVNGFVDGIGRAEAAVKSGGKNMQQWGKNQINGFGNSAKAVDTFFDGIGKKRIQNIKAEVAEIKKLDPTYNAVGATLAGSKEAYSIEARFRTEGLFAKDKEAKQLEEQRKANALLKQVVDGVSSIKLPTFGIL